MALPLPHGPHAEVIELHPRRLARAEPSTEERGGLVSSTRGGAGDGPDAAGVRGGTGDGPGAVAGVRGDAGDAPDAVGVRRETGDGPIALDGAWGDGPGPGDGRAGDRVDVPHDASAVDSVIADSTWGAPAEALRSDTADAARGAAAAADGPHDAPALTPPTAAFT